MAFSRASAILCSPGDEATVVPSTSSPQLKAEASSSSPMEKRTRVISFYLPQYHPIPENDLWWGKGFTEWTNVARAKPLFPGHYQPHVPSDLGFYDLRVPEVREAQAEMAAASGVEAFCYYHYWFAGRRILERPFEEVLRSGRPDFPFCLCWANQTWSGIWHGCPGRILIEQTYPGVADHLEHFRALLGAFEDPRYLKVDDKPLFIIYRPMQVPEVLRATELWREAAAAAGLKGLYLVGLEVDEEPDWNPHAHGFDASLYPFLPPLRRPPPWRQPFGRLKHELHQKILRLTGAATPLSYRPTVYSYEEVMLACVRKRDAPVRSYPCVIPT